MKHSCGVLCAEDARGRAVNIAIIHFVLLICGVLLGTFACAQVALAAYIQFTLTRFRAIHVAQWTKPLRPMLNLRQVSSTGVTCLRWLSPVVVCSLLAGQVLAQGSGLQITPSTYDFGYLPVGQSFSTTITVKNTTYSVAYPNSVTTSGDYSEGHTAAIQFIRISHAHLP